MRCLVESTQVAPTPFFLPAFCILPFRWSVSVSPPSCQINKAFRVSRDLAPHWFTDCQPSTNHSIPVSTYNLAFSRPPRSLLSSQCFCMSHFLPVTVSTPCLSPSSFCYPLPLCFLHLSNYIFLLPVTLLLPVPDFLTSYSFSHFLHSHSSPSCRHCFGLSFLIKLPSCLFLPSSPMCSSSPFLFTFSFTIYSLSKFL